MNKTNVRQTFFQVSLVSRPNDLITWPTVASLSVTVLYLVLIFFLRFASTDTQVSLRVRNPGFDQYGGCILWFVVTRFLVCTKEQVLFTFPSLEHQWHSRIPESLIVWFCFRFKVASSNTSVFEEPFIQAQFFPNSATSGCFVHESQYGERIIICFIRYTVSKLYNFCFLGYTISTLSPTVATASSISAPLLLPLLLLGGFYVKNT